MWPNPQFPEDLAIFTGEILNGKLHFLCSASCMVLHSFLKSFKIISAEAKSVVKYSRILIYQMIFLKVNQKGSVNTLFMQLIKKLKTFEVECDLLFTTILLCFETILLNILFSNDHWKNRSWSEYLKALHQVFSISKKGKGHTFSCKFQNCYKNLLGLYPN